MRRAGTIVAILALAALAGLGAYRAGVLQLVRPDPAEYPVRGIDVSHHQGAIDWSKVAGDGVRFAYLKASEGRDHRDTSFATNWSAAAATGIPRGAYHFFTFCSPGSDQAEHFLRVVPPERGALRPVADVEFVGNCRSWTSLEAVRAELRVFLERVAAAWDRQPILYVTADAYDRVLAGQFSGYAIWIREIFRQPAPEEYGGWLIWQFSETGRVPGIAGPVDLDVLRPGATPLDLGVAAR